MTCLGLEGMNMFALKKKSQHYNAFLFSYISLYAVVRWQNELLQFLEAS